MRSALTEALGRQRLRTLFPGVMACAVVAAVAGSLGQHCGAPVLLPVIVLASA